MMPDWDVSLLLWVLGAAVVGGAHLVRREDGPDGPHAPGPMGA